MSVQKTVAVGDTAPPFSLPGYHDGSIRQFSLSEAVGEGKRVLLVFYPGDFTPVCSEQLCEHDDADWYTYRQDLQVFAISRDSVFCHRAFARKNNIECPLLSDVPGEVCDAYGVLGEEPDWGGQIPQRSVFVVGGDMTISYAWRAEDNWTKPSENPVKTAIRAV